MNNTINLFMEKLFYKARENELKAFEAYYAQGESFRVMVFEGEVSDYSVDKSSGLSFRALVDGHMGYSYTQALDDKAIDMLIDQATQNAKVIECEDTQFIFSGSDKYEEIETYNPALDAVSAKDKINLALELEKKALAKHELIKSVGYCMVQTNSATIRIKNSNGLDLSHKDNVIIAYLNPIAHKDGKMVDGSAFKGGRNIDDIDVDDIVKRAVDDAISMIDAAPVKSQKYDIVFDKDTASDLLETFSGMFSAESAQKGLSLLKGKEGEKIAADIVTIIDDPLLEGGFSSTPFDSEGVATKTKSIVENGVLKTLLYNLKTAAKDGVESTGNASKSSYNAPVNISSYNFYIKPADNPISKLFEQVNDGLYITDLSGLHAADTISADFSLSAKGFQIKDGKKGRAVEQVTVAGNFYELLKNVEMIADDLSFDTSGSGSLASPSILVKGIFVAGE